MKGSQLVSPVFKDECMNVCFVLFFFSCFLDWGCSPPLPLVSVRTADVDIEGFIDL